MRYRRQPIEDLPEDANALSDGEFASLREVWLDRRTVVEGTEALEKFNLRWAREWSIETGAIEGLYFFDRGLTETLIERGIEADLIGHSPTTEYTVQLIRDHQDTLEGIFEFVKGGRAISVSYIRELHASLTRHQNTYTVRDSLGNLFEKKLEPGAFKSQPNNPTKPDKSIHEYCPPEQVASEMDRLVEIHAAQVSRGVPTEVQAAWLHHAFAQIHPFPDGNGRVARALATAIFIRAGMFPLIVTQKIRDNYLDALEAADRGDLIQLVDRFVSVQRRATITATALAYELASGPPTVISAGTPTIEGEISAVRDKLVREKKIAVREWLNAESTANRLVDVTVERLHLLERGLVLELQSVQPKYQFSPGGMYVDSPACTAMAEQYEGDFTDHRYRRATGILLKTDFDAAIWVAFHSLGPTFRGLIGVAMVFSVGAAESQNSGPLKSELFPVNYKEPMAQAEARFVRWLEQGLIAGLREWRELL